MRGGGADLGMGGADAGDAASEMERLASLVEWRAGTIAADIGAGDGRYSLAADLAGSLGV